MVLEKGVRHAPKGTPTPGGYIKIYDIIAALQHVGNHTIYKGLNMFSFDEQYKKFEELAERTKQAYEFWYNCLVSTWEDFYKPKKK